MTIDFGELPGLLEKPYFPEGARLRCLECREGYYGDNTVWVIKKSIYGFMINPEKGDSNPLNGYDGRWVLIAPPQTPLKDYL